MLSTFISDSLWEDDPRIAAASLPSLIEECARLESEVLALRDLERRANEAGCDLGYLERLEEFRRLRTIDLDCARRELEELLLFSALP